MKVGIWGLGALGLTYASYMSSNKIDLTIICDDERKDRYSKTDFYANGIKYNFYYSTPNEILKNNVKFDLILIGVKRYNLKEILDDLKLIVNDNTTVFSLLNGIDSEDIIADKIGKHHILHGYISNVDTTKKGNSVCYKNPGKFRLGMGYDKVDIYNHCSKLIKLLEDSNIEYVYENDIIKSQWSKFMLNVGVNQVTAILRFNYGSLNSSAYASNLVKIACEEVIAIANAKNIDLGDDDVQMTFNILKTLLEDGKTSMLQDVEAKRKTEVDMLAGRVISMGKQLGIPTPVNELFFLQIKALEEM